jgi:hypothetical protein
VVRKKDEGRKDDEERKKVKGRMIGGGRKGKDERR